MRKQFIKTAILSISSLNDRLRLKYANFRRCYSAFLTIVKSYYGPLKPRPFALIWKYIASSYCFNLVVSLCNQQKQVIFILVIQLSKKTAPKDLYLYLYLFICHKITITKRCQKKKMQEEMARRPKGNYKAYVNQASSITIFRRWHKNYGDGYKII